MATNPIDHLKSLCESGEEDEVQNWLSETQKNFDINHRFSYDKNNTVLHIACRRGDLGIVNILVASFPQIDFNQENDDNQTPFFLACKKNNIEVIKCLCSIPLVDINKCECVNSTGYTPLHYACCYNLIDVVRILLNQNSIQINLSDTNDEYTPLHIACSEGYLGITKLLLNHKDIHVNQRNKKGETAFFISCQKTKIDIVNYLCTDWRTDINQCDNNNLTPLCDACVKNSIDITRILLAQSNILSHKSINNDGNSLLHVACWNGDFETVQKLCEGDLQKEVFFELKNNFERTPFYLACENSQIKIVEYLFNKYDFNQQDIE